MALGQVQPAHCQARPKAPDREQGVLVGEPLALVHELPHSRDGLLRIPALAPGGDLQCSQKRTTTFSWCHARTATGGLKPLLSDLRRCKPAWRASALRALTPDHAGSRYTITMLVPLRVADGIV